MIFLPELGAVVVPPLVAVATQVAVSEVVWLVSRVAPAQALGPAPPRSFPL